MKTSKWTQRNTCPSNTWRRSDKTHKSHRTISRSFRRRANFVHQRMRPDWRTTMGTQKQAKNKPTNEPTTFTIEALLVNAPTQLKDFPQKFPKTTQVANEQSKDAPYNTWSSDCSVKSIRNMYYFKTPHTNIMVATWTDCSIKTKLLSEKISMKQDESYIIKYCYLEGYFRACTIPTRNCS